MKTQLTGKKQHFLLYNKHDPSEIVPVVTDRELYSLYQRGYKKVHVSVVARILKRMREKTQFSALDVLNLLSDRGVHLSMNAYREIENGKLNRSFTIHLLKELSLMLHMPIEALVRGSR